MINNLLGLFNEIGKWINNRPQRLKEQALESAFQYIMINETDKYKDQELSEKHKAKLLLHFKKRFMAWRDGS